MQIHEDEGACLSVLPDPLKNLFFNITPGSIAQNDQHLSVCSQLTFIATKPTSNQYSKRRDYAKIGR